MKYSIVHAGDNWLPDESKRGLGRRKIIYMWIIIVTCIAIAVSHWKNQIDGPCFPGNFGYFLLSECNGNMSPPFYEKVLKVVLSTFSATLYLFTISTVFLEYEISMLHAYCITNYLRLFMQNFDKQIDAKNVSNPNMQKLFLMYRETELLTKSYNWFRAGTCVSFNVIDCTIAFIIASYSVIRLRTVLPFVAVVNCWVLVVDGYCAIKEWNEYKSGVFKVSTELIAKVTKNRQLSTHKIYRRQIKSWRILRIYLGSDNFFDELTPLNLVDFGVGQTVSLLLL